MDVDKTGQDGVHPLWSDDYADFVFDGADDFESSSDIVAERPLGGSLDWGSIKFGDAYSKGKLALIFNVTSGFDRTNQEFVCASNTFWGHFLLDSVVKNRFRDAPFIKICNALQGDLMFHGAGNLQQVPKIAVASSVIWTRPPWLKGLKLWNDGGANMLTSSLSGEDFVKIVWIKGGREENTRALCLAVYTDGCGIDGLIKSATHRSNHGESFSSESFGGTWSDYLDNVVSGLKIVLTDNRCAITFKEIVG